MPKKKDLLDSICETGLSAIFNIAMMNVGTKLQVLIHGAIRPLIKKIIVGIIGAALVTIGVLFVCLSLVKYVSIYIDVWMAWGSVGIAILIIGFLMAMSSLRR